MTRMAEVVSRFLKGSGKVAVVGMGNPLMRDDGAGILACKLLANHGLNLDVYEARQAPEAVLPLITKGPYTHVILIDAAEMGLKPGEVGIVDPESELAQPLLTTHYFPLHALTDTLKRAGKEVLVIGIQPKEVRIGIGLSHEVIEGVRALVEDLRKALSLSDESPKTGGDDDDR